MSLTETHMIHKLFKYGFNSHILVGEILSNLPSEVLYRFIFEVKPKYKPTAMEIISQTMKNDKIQYEDSMIPDLLQLSKFILQILL